MLLVRFEPEIRLSEPIFGWFTEGMLKANSALAGTEPGMSWATHVRYRCVRATAQR
jgi:hypothetical protein